MTKKMFTKKTYLDISITGTQKRIWAALKKRYRYDTKIFERSEKFLRNNAFSRVDMVILYIDLVGSTKMTLELPKDKLAIIISSFTQEMALIIMQYNGYVLKFIGDAVIGYFITKNKLSVVDDTIKCANFMINVINDGINQILNQYDYPDLMVKIGIDFGQNIIVRYGTNKKKSHVDLLGPSMNIASKIQNLAEPNQIFIGEDVYTILQSKTKEKFELVNFKNNWNYYSKKTGNIYLVYKCTVH